MKSITLEYFEKQLRVLYEDEMDLQRSLLKQYIYSEKMDIYITPDGMFDKEAEIECLKKLHLNKNGFDVYMYVVKVDRSRLPRKPII